MTTNDLTVRAEGQDVKGADPFFDDSLDFGVFDWTPPEYTEQEVEKASLSEQFKASPMGHARKWVKMGWNVIPIHPKTKAPLLKFKPYLGAKGVRVSEKMLALWFLWRFNGQSPNYALLLDSGPFPLVAVDLDHQDCFPWGDSVMGVSPLEVKSGRDDGGKHIYFRGNALLPQKQSIGRMGPDLHVEWGWRIDPVARQISYVKKFGVTKVDIKSSGSYVLGEGSLHPKTGRAYSTSADITPELLASLPEWDFLKFKALVSEHKARVQLVQAHAEAALEKSFPRPEGLTREQGEKVARLCLLSGKVVKPGKKDAVNLAVLEACPITLWAKANPECLTYTIRYTLASNISKLAGKDGEREFLSILAGHPEYDDAEARAIWASAMDTIDRAPVTYKHAHEEGGWPGPVPSGVRSPAGLLYQVVQADEDTILKAAAMNRYSFVATQNKVYDFDLNEFYGVDAFNLLGKDYRLWMSSDFDEVRNIFKNITFKTDGNVHPETLNMFDRSRMAKPSGKPVAEAPLGVWWVTNSLTNQNPEEAEYLLKWLAWRVRYPWTPQCALVLSGPEGTGKGMFSTMAKILCDPFCATIGQVEIESDWNSYMAKSILVVANEISAESTKDARRVANNLKALVLAGERVSVNPKGGKMYEIHNSTGWIICTNHDLAISLGKTDRRYSIFNGNTPLKEQNPTGESDVIWMADNLKNPVWKQHFIDYIYSLDLTGFQYQTPYKNSSRDTAMEASLRPVELWWKTILSSEGDIPPGKYPSHFLWERFRRWAATNGERSDSYTHTGFARSIPQAEVKKSRVQRSTVDARQLVHGSPQTKQVFVWEIPNKGQTSVLVYDGVGELRLPN